MKRISLLLITCLLLTFGFKVTAQTNVFPTTGAAGIGTTDPAPSALLDVVSTNKGVLIPRMTKVQRDAIVSPTVGLLIYQTNLTPGFYYFDGSGWTAMSSKDATRTLNNLTTTAVNATLQPGTDNTIDLGASAFSWKNLYVDGVGYLGSIKIGNFIGTPTAGHIRWTGSDFEGYNGSTWVSLTATGPGGGGAAETDLSNLSATSINTDLIPDSDKTHDMGSNINNWNNIYMKGSIYTGNFHAFTPNLNGTLYFGYNNRADKGALFYGNILMGQSAGELINNTSVGNIAIGQNSMNGSTASVFHNVAIGFDVASDITGNDNIFLGYTAGQFATTGNDNNVIGKGAGKNNTGNGNNILGSSAGASNGGDNNIIIGNNSGGFNSGSNNLLIGGGAGADNQADNNLFIGSYAGADNTTGTENMFFGINAGSRNTTGSYNCYFGASDATAPPFGDYNTAMGYQVASPMGSGNTVYGALAGNTITGTNNTVLGYSAATLLAEGSYNVVLGANAAHELFSGTTNVVIGNNAGYALFSGDQNVYIGGDAGRNTTLGNYNVAIGNYAGNDLVLSSNNTFIGNSAGYNVDANYNVAVGASSASAFSMSEGTFLGYNADVTTSGLSNVIAIGKDATVSSSNTVRIGNISVNKIGIGKAPGATSILDFQATTARLSTGGTWVNASDERIKDQKQQLDAQEILNNILELKIERWHYIADSTPVFHIGPYAQQFNELFDVGDDTTISTIDPAGVALIGIQGLNTRFDSSNIVLNELIQQNQLLTEKLNEMTTLINQIQNNMLVCCGDVSSNQSVILSNDLPELGQNIPNPFDKTTIIPYRIPTDCNSAYIMITEITTGKIIIEEEVDCFQNQLVVHTSNIAAGTYAYTLIVNGATIDTKLMIVQR